MEQVGGDEDAKAEPETDQSTKPKARDSDQWVANFRVDFFSKEMK